ncbi:MAG: hypothetical protein AMXMBFR61_25250 [Fimbriimonadales bacterium]
MGERQRSTEKAQDYPTTVWDFPNRGAGHDDVEHATVESVGVFQIPMLQHTERGKMCYESLAGSGTQLVAAEQAVLRDGDRARVRGG